MKSKEESRKRSSNVGQVIRSISEAFGIATSNFDVQKVVSFDEGKFVINNDELVKILEGGTVRDKIEALKLLEEEMVNISSEKSLEIWETVKDIVDLKDGGAVRTEVFTFLGELLRLEKMPATNGTEIYYDICNNINLSDKDPDMKQILVCLHDLMKIVDLKSFEKSEVKPLDEFLVQVFKQVQRYESEDLSVLIISLISQCIGIDPALFSAGDLEFLLDNIIETNIKTSNMLVITAFVEFFKGYLSTVGKYKDNLYAIISILGCACDLEEVESTGNCEIVIDRLLSTDPTQFLFTLCDVISGKCDNKFRHRIGDRYIVGCIRYLCYVLKYLGSTRTEGKVVTEFFEHHLYYLLHCFSHVAERNDPHISIEILKFLDELLEKPYVLEGYYKYLVAQNAFWDMLMLLNWNSRAEISFSYQAVLNELFNKLQNCELNKYYLKRLIDYFEYNYQILTSYNISFVLKYYSDNLLCVCGSSNWKLNCQQIIERYFSTSSFEVLSVLKDSFSYCVDLKIDKPSLEFYVNLICYSCVIGLSFKLDVSVIKPLTNVILDLDNTIFQKVTEDYTIEAQNSKDINAETISKSLIVLILQSTKATANYEKVSILLNSILKMLKNSEKIKSKKIFMMHILLVSKLRTCKKGELKYFYFEKLYIDSELNDNLLEKYGDSYSFNEQDVANRINDIIRKASCDFSFLKCIEGEQSKLFNINLETKILLDLYTNILEHTNILEYYVYVLKHIRNQILNFDLFENGCFAALSNLASVFTTQMELIYSFNFPLPDWLKIENLRTIIVDTMYGLLPYKDVIVEHDINNLVRSIALDFHFCAMTRASFLHFLNCCFFEIPSIMKNFILPILKMIHDDLAKPDTFFTSLEFLFVLYQTIDGLDLEQSQNDQISKILEYLDNYQIPNESSDYNYAMCCAVLKEIVKGIRESNIADAKFLKPKSDLQFINICDGVGGDQSLFKQMSEMYKTDPISKVISSEQKVSVLSMTMSQLLSLEYNAHTVTILFLEDRLDYNIITNYSGKIIVITRADSCDQYFNVNTFNFQYLSIRNVIIDRENIGKYITVLVEICSITTISTQSQQIKR